MLVEALAFFDLGWFYTRDLLVFVVGYLGVAFCIILVAWTAAYKDDRDVSLEPLSSQEEPMILALLHGREELMRVVTFGLLLRGYLMEPESPRKNPAAPDRRHLNPIEAALYDAEGKVSEQVIKVCRDLEQRLIERGLLVPLTAKRRNIVLKYGVIGVLLGIGIGRVWLVHDKVLDLLWCFIAMFGALLLAWIVLPVPSRLTAKGTRLLSDKQREYSDLKDHLGWAVSGVSPQVDPEANEPTLVLLISVFGSKVLKGTAYEHLIPAV